MNKMTTRKRVLVGVDGSRASRYALLWAAREARIRHSDLMITHIDPPSSGAVDVNGEPVEGETVLEASVAAAAEQEPSVRVDTLLLHGPIADQLIKLSESVDMLVVGVESTKPRGAHGLIGPIEDRVVVHALCPVVTVHGTQESVRVAHRDVVVGWKENQSGHLPLEAAAQEAHLRNASLTLVFVLPHDDHQLGHADPNLAAEQELVDAVAAIEREYPALPVNVIRRRGDVLSTLRQQAHSAELLVIGCPHVEDRWSIRTGQVAGALMREASCPVMLVGRRAADPVARRRPQPS